MSRSLWFALLLAMAGCAEDPVKTANTTQQKAYATYGSFVVFEEVAAQVVQDVGVPEAAKVGIRAADRVAKPTMDQLLAAVLAVETLRAPDSNPMQMATAVMNLNRLLAEAGPELQALIAAVEGAKHAKQ